MVAPQPTRSRLCSLSRRSQEQTILRMLRRSSTPPVGRGLRVTDVVYDKTLQLMNYEFSVPQSKLADYQRQIRKMRCDDQPEGCTSCRQAQTECKTTDRITGKATVRGYVESLESRLAELERLNQQLRSQVMCLGGQVSSEHTAQRHTPDQYFQLPQAHTSQAPQTPLSNGVAERHDLQGPNDNQHDSLHGTETGRMRLPEFRSGLSGNNYLGISSGNSLVNSVRGTSMNILGMEIDLVDYMSADLDEPDPSRGQPVYNKSYRAFVQTAFGTSPKLRRVELPPRSEGIRYAEAFFRVIHPFTPVVHQPSFMKLVSDKSDFPIAVWLTVLAFAHVR